LATVPCGKADCASIATRLRRQGTESGTLKKNRLPRPGALSTQMRPPCASTMPRAMESPSPTPWAVGPCGPWK